jgi:hypothetical protein
MARNCSLLNTDKRSMVERFVYLMHRNGAAQSAGQSNVVEAVS